MPRNWKATSTLHAAQKAGKGSRPRQGARQRQAAGARAATPRDSGGRNARAAKRSRAIDIDHDANNMAGMCIAADHRIPLQNLRIRRRRHRLHLTTQKSSLVGAGVPPAQISILVF